MSGDQRTMSGAGPAARAEPARPAFQLLMRLQGIGDASSVSRAELNAYLALVKGQDKGRAFQQTS